MPTFRLFSTARSSGLAAFAIVFLLGGISLSWGAPGDTHTAFTSLAPDMQPGYSTVLQFADPISGSDTSAGYQSAAFRFTATESGPLEKILVALYGYGDAGTDLSVNVVLRTDSGGKIGGAIASFPINGVEVGNFKGYFANPDPEYGIVLRKGGTYWLSLEPLTIDSHVAWAQGGAGPHVKKFSDSGGQSLYSTHDDIADLMIVDVYVPFPPQVQNPGVPLVEGQQVPGEPQGTDLKSLGPVPQAPLLGSLKAGAKITPAILGSDGTVLLRVGDAAPGLTSATILSLQQPSGDAVVAKLKRQAAAGGSTAITAANDAVLIGGLQSGTLALLARSGDSINDGTGATIKSFTSIEGGGTSVFFFAALSGAGVNATNNSALCSAAAGSAAVALVRKGETADGQVVTTIGTLSAATGTVAQGRWRLDDQTIGARLTFSDKSVSLVSLPAAGGGPASWTSYLATGAVLPAPLAQAVIASIGIPSFGAEGVACPATLKVGVGGVTAKNHAVLLSVTSNSLAVIAREGDPAVAADGSAIAGVSFSSFGNPVSGASSHAAFTARLSSATNNTGIWYYDGTALRMRARQGGSAAGLGTYARFTNLILPSGSSGEPVFQAVLAGDAAVDVNAKSNAGIWGLGTDNNVHLLARAGGYLFLNDSYFGTIESLSALTTAAGSTGAFHGVDADGSVRVNAVFANRATPGMVRAQFSIPVPAGPPAD